MGEQVIEQEKKISIFGAIKNAVRLIYQADKRFVWFSIYKNTTEGIFNALKAMYLIKFIYECIQNGVDFEKLFWMVSVFCIIHIIIHLTSAYHSYCLKISEMKVYRYIFSGIIEKAKKIPVSQYENPKFYDKFSRALDQQMLRGIWGMIFATLGIGDICGGLVAVFMLANVDVVLILFAILPVLGSLYLGLRESREEFMARQDETFGNRKMEYAKRVFYEKKYASELRLYQMAKVMFRVHKEGYMERYEKNRAHYRKIGLYRILETMLFVGLVTLGSYLYIAYRLKVVGSTAVAAYIAMIAAVGYVVNSVNGAIENFSQSGKRCMYMQYITEFMECEEEKEEDFEEKGQELPTEKSTEKRTDAISAAKDGADEENMLPVGDIRFESVSYHYAGSERLILDHLNLHVKQGEHVALVGENGAGKTTFVKLLMGLYPLSEGKIYVGGRNIKSYPPEAYHDFFGTVFQDFQIFSLPLCENVWMRTPESEKEREKITEALKKAQFAEVLQKMPNGIDTYLTKEFEENGFVCSGGEAQKIAIARVFAKDPEIVILDEPSSALDPISEYHMYQNMMEASEGKTVFFISHRMSSARLADRILFLENGTIVEDGSHDELMRKNGRYAEMFRMQAKNYQDSH